MFYLHLLCSVVCLLVCSLILGMTDASLKKKNPLCSIKSSQSYVLPVMDVKMKTGSTDHGKKMSKPYSKDSK